MTERPFATSIRDLAEAAGIPERKLTTLLKSDPAAPEKTTNGYDVLAVVEWYGRLESNSLNQQEPLNPGATAASEAIEATEPAVRFITIRIPVAAPQGYLATSRQITPRHIDCHVRDPEEIHAVNSLLQGCISSHQQMANGEHVDRLGHVIRWLAREIRDQMKA